MRLCRTNSDWQTTDFLLAPLPDLGQMRPCASQVIRSLTWALKQVDPVSLHRQSGILYTLFVPITRAPPNNLVSIPLTLLAKLRCQNVVTT